MERWKKEENNKLIQKPSEKSMLSTCQHHYTVYLQKKVSVYTWLLYFLNASSVETIPDEEMFSTSLSSFSSPKDEWIFGI